jgi:hypothetical protein
MNEVTKETGAELHAQPAETTPGEITPKDPGWSALTVKEKFAYFDAHKEAVIEDLARLTYDEMMQKWGTNSAVVTQLKRRYGIPVAAYSRKGVTAGKERNPSHQTVESGGESESLVKITKFHIGDATVNKIYKRIDAIAERLSQLEERPADEVETEKQREAPFPAWNEAWGDAVKVAWLNAYAQMT